MSPKKQLLYLLITMLMMINTMVLYFGGGLPPLSLTQTYFSTIAGALGTFLFLFLSLGLYTLSFSITRVLYKKNLLRINILLLSLFFIISIIGRGMELYNGTFCGICWLNTLGFFLLGVITIVTLRDLYRLSRELFSRHL